MKKIYQLLLFICAFCCMEELAAQDRLVSGRVLSASDGTPVIGASVVVKGTTTGTNTDASGNYSVSVPASANTLVVSFIGFLSQEVPLNGRSSIDVTLRPDVQQLTEVVVTALGISREKRALGYATQSVDSAALNFNRQPNVLNALQGKVAGAQISSTGGAPGQGSSIIIRGINSIDPSRSNQPLFVIDGVLIDNSTSTVGSGAELRGMSNRATDINPDDIESINVLKGGAATALYGLRGANGVIVINTKSGKSGQMRVNFSSTYGFENVNKTPDIQRTYTAGILGVYTPIGLGPAWGPTVAEAKELDPTHPDEIYDNHERAYRTGHQFRNSLSFSGGTEAVTFLSSLSYFKHEGMIPFTDYKNFSARLNTNIKVSQKINISTNMSFTNSGGDRYNADRFGESLAYFSGRWDVREYMNPDGTQIWRGTNNPLYGAETNKMVDNVDRFIGGFTFGYQPTEWLNLNYRIGLDTYSDERTRTAPGPRGITGERLYDNGNGFVGEYNTKFRAINSTFVATLNHDFGSDFSATLRLGQDLYDRRQESVGFEGSNLTIFDWYVLRNATVLSSIAPNLREYRLMGLFGEATFDYRNFLFLSVTGRNDVTSTLLSPNNSFFYPSVSLGYVFSEQFNLPDVITFGKLRASYAQIGKDANEYSTSTGFASYGNLPTGVTGFTKAANLGDPTLKPEFTNTFEAGLEMSFLDSRLGFDVTVYNSISKDQIINAAVTSTTGYVTASINAGSMRNRGIELILKATPVRTTNFTWTTNLNFSANRNKILSLKEGLDEIIVASQSGYLNSAVTMKLIPGAAYGNLYGTSYQRYYAPGEKEDPTILDESRPLLIGANGFPVRAPVATQKLLGNSQPDWIGGITNTFSYKGLSLTALVDARWGQEKYNQLENFYAAFGIADYTADRREFKVFEGVLADGTPNTKSVWLGQGAGPDGVAYGEGYYRNIYRGVSENFVQDASWVRLRSLSLTYSLPTQWLPKNFIRNASVSATGNNVWLYTPFYGLDPESSSFNSGSNVDGYAGFTYPAARSFLFSVNVGF